MHLERHSNPHCSRIDVYLCVICWRHVCWCKGAADDVDLAGSMSGLVDPATSDTGVCDDCWFVLGAEALRVQEVEEVQFVT